jgi:hypothetical protein
MLATHVVSTGQHVTKWWTTQDELVAITAGHFESEIGVSSGDDVKGEWADGTRNIGFEPIGDLADVETWDAGRFATHTPVRYPRTADLLCS